jgi:N-acetylneuraminate synthase
VNKRNLKSAEVIVEIGNTHEGSLGIAKSFIDMVAKSGAKVAKFQMHLAEYEGTKNEPFRVKFSEQDDTRQDYWKRINFSKENWVEISRYCNSLGIEFLCTPFSVEAARFLDEHNLVKRWKVGSGQAVEWPLIDFLSNTKKPLIISTGLISPQEINLLKERLTRLSSWSKTTLLHCVSKYPVSIHEIDLHLMLDLQKLGCSFGYSDHSGHWFVPISAIAMGAEIVEVHMTPHKSFFGPDVSSSLLPEEIGRIVNFANIFTSITTSSRSKNEHFQEVEQMRRLFRKGLYWSRNKYAGDKVTIEDFRFLKPVVEIDTVDYELLLGEKLEHNVMKDDPVRKRDFGNI